ncbi:MAG: hypothetical protein Q4C03_06700 [bacterium]|nr:hypothetical protein [bacterium]
MLNKGIETYTYYSGLSGLSSTDLNGLCDYGVEYNRVRLDSLGHSIPNTGIGNDQYINSDLYKLQNPDFETDWAANHSIYPSGRPLLVQRILQNYLLYPTYNVNLFSGLNGSPIDFVHSAFDPSKDFFATIPSDYWEQIIEAAYNSFKDSLSGQEGSSAISGKYDEDSYERKLVVDQIRSNPGDAVKTEKKVENKETVVYSETLEEFEKEYQAFIEMLKAQKAQKS